MKLRCKQMRYEAVQMAIMRTQIMARKGMEWPTSITRGRCSITTAIMIMVIMMLMMRGTRRTTAPFELQHLFSSDGVFEMVVVSNHSGDLSFVFRVCHGREVFADVFFHKLVCDVVLRIFGQVLPNSRYGVKSDEEVLLLQCL